VSLASRQPTAVDHHSKEDIIVLIGVFSDVHDQLGNLKKALEVFASRNIDTAIFCGDFCSPIVARAMAEFAGTVHCVFGNGDGDRFAMLNFSHGAGSNLVLHGEHAELELGGAKIAVTHYPLYAQALARTGDYQAVFSGHTHQQTEERFDGCLWVNPGDVMGWRNPPTVAIYDSGANRADIVALLE
jgi:hypothetical protein